MRETFVIEDNCSFIGQRLSQLGLSHSYVDIKLIRNEENTMLEATDPLAAGDRLILTGTNKAVERARKALQSQRAIN
jgi:Trk K+ transport system NAD-binding subunit